MDKMETNNTNTTVPDEVVIEALLKDARRFKSKWELHTNEPTRSKPNVGFLKRTLTSVVKTNQDRMRTPKRPECEERLEEAASTSKRSDSPKAKKSKSCSKSKYRSPERKKSPKKPKEKGKKKLRSPRR